MTQVIEAEALEVRACVLGVLLRNARERAGKTQRELAQALGCSEARVRAYEFGEKGFTLPELELAACFLTVSTAELLDENATAGEFAPGEDPKTVIGVRQRIIGTLLQQARIATGRTLPELSRAVGITQDRLRKFEYGDRPVPLPLLEALAGELGVQIDYFRDGVPDDTAAWIQAQGDFRHFETLPPEVREFVLSPVNVSYLQLAMRLSEMPAERLRAIAEALLDITY